MRLTIRLFLFALFTLPFQPCWAGTEVEDSPAFTVGAKTCVSVSTSTWTKWPTTNVLGRRSGIKILNPTSHSAAIEGELLAAIDGTLATSTATATIGIDPGENPLIPAGFNINLWLISRHTSAETVCGQDIRQAN